MADVRDAPAAGEVAVLVVGGGPTGLTLANLLGARGEDTLVVERNPGTVDEPRAVSFDDESLRTLQGCGLQSEAYDLVVPGTGTKFYGMDGRPLGYARGPAIPPLGHPVKNPFSQPAFERMLLDGLQRFDAVEVRHDCVLEALDLSAADAAVATLRSADGTLERVRAQIAVGCDGGRSTVRAAAQISMLGASLGEPWLVIDVLEDEHDERYAMHHCDPRRPFVIVPGRDGRCRYEFMVMPGERPEELVELAEVRRLMAPFRPIDAGQIERCTVYTFHALVAERWRSGRALLAGDAAHMMPPFAGQGLNSGIRDAANLAWKIAAVVAGEADASLLDTYEAERRPHAEATVALSVRLGQVMMSRRVRLARARDAVIRSASALVPAVERWISTGRFKPVAHFGDGGAIIPGPDVVGRMLPQPTVLCSDGGVRLLDDVLGPGFALVAVDPAGPALQRLDHPVWRTLRPTLVDARLDDRSARRGASGVQVVADYDGALTAALAPHRGRLLLIRPDRFVMAVLSGDADTAASQVEAALRFAPGREGQAEAAGAAATPATAAPADRSGHEVRHA